jgi:arsenate reductase (glutaredoxin)
MITIYRNPDCGTSRNTLAMIRKSGEEPTVIEYLKHPPSRERLIELIRGMNIPVRQLLRERVRLMQNWDLAIRNGRRSTDRFYVEIPDPDQSPDSRDTQGCAALPAI